jgi:hypothetical protein
VALLRQVCGIPDGRADGDSAAAMRLGLTGQSLGEFVELLAGRCQPSASRNPGR